MRLVLATMVAAAALAACGQSGGGGAAKTEEAGAKSSPAEEKVATEVVDAGGVLMLGDETISQVIGGAVQMVAMQNPDMTPEQLEKVQTAIRKNIDAELPGLKKEMGAHLTEAFSEGELKTYQAFVTAPKEGESIKDRTSAVMQKSIESADAMTSKAVEKAVAEVKGAAPVAPAAPADAAAPAAPAKPN
jgi:iron uptake system EfeUOB component EfeO/EfeM